MKFNNEELSKIDHKIDILENYQILAKDNKFIIETFKDATGINYSEVDNEIKYLKGILKSYNWKKRYYCLECGNYLDDKVMLCDECDLNRFKKKFYELVFDFKSIEDKIYKFIKTL